METALAGRRLFAVAILLAITTFAISGPAVERTNQGSSGMPGVTGLTGGIWWAPAATWEISKNSLQTDYFNGVTSALNQAYSPTDLTILQSTTTSCIVSGDMCAMDSDYGDNGVFGWNACYPGSTAGNHPNQTCNNDWVRLNTHYVPPTYQYNACHEIGHATGLRHNLDQSSCVKRAIDGGDSLVISNHDAGHLNAHY